MVISLDTMNSRSWRRSSIPAKGKGSNPACSPFYTKILAHQARYIDVVEGMPLINLRRVPLDNLVNGFLKRSFDIVASLLGLVLLSPVFLGVAIGVKCSSPGPVILPPDTHRPPQEGIYYV